MDEGPPIELSLKAQITFRCATAANEPHPGQMLRLAHIMLRPDGLLFIAVSTSASGILATSRGSPGPWGWCASRLPKTTLVSDRAFCASSHRDPSAQRLDFQVGDGHATPNGVWPSASDPCLVGCGNSNPTLPTPSYNLTRTCLLTAVAVPRTLFYSSRSRASRTRGT